MIYWEVSGSAALMVKFIKIGLSGRVEAILREGVQNKMRRTGLKISGNISYGLMNPNLKCMVSSISMYREDQERDTTMSVYMVEALSAFFISASFGNLVKKLPICEKLPSHFNRSTISKTYD